MVKLCQTPANPVRETKEISKDGFPSFRAASPADSGNFGQVADRQGHFDVSPFGRM